MTVLAGPTTALVLCLGVSSGQGGGEVVAKARELGLQYVAAGRFCDDHSDEPGSLVDELEVAAMARSRKIGEELAASDRPAWAGDYTYGDGLGVNVVLRAAPKSGVTYTWTGCLGLYDVNHGDVVEATSDRLKVKLAVDPERNWRIYEVSAPRLILSEEWCFAAWGDREYLIPSSRMVAFCNGANSGRGVELSSFASRTLDGSLKRRRILEPFPRGLPRVPREYEPFLVSQPLDGAIVKANPPACIGAYENGGTDAPPKYQVTAETNIGERDGLLPGMVLYVVESEGRGEAEVVTTADATSRIEFRFAMWDAARDVPKAGWKVSTRHPRADAR